LKITILALVAIYKNPEEDIPEFEKTGEKKGEKKESKMNN